MNKVLFLVSLSHHIHKITVCNLESIKISVLESKVKKIIKIYGLRGFDLKYVLVDIQFKSLKNYRLLPVVVNLVTKGEHLQEIERFIWLIKESG